MDDAEKAGKRFTELVRILDVLRGENGCPWDRQQDEKTLVNYFLEESYEVIDSVFNKKPDSVAEELGDMLMEIVFLARLYKEKADFCMSDVVEGINRKMIRRHPHVFGDHSAADADEVTASWNRQKNTEKNRESLFDGISSCTPALLTAFQIGLRASLSGFDWSEAAAVIGKVKGYFHLFVIQNVLGIRDVDDNIEFVVTLRCKVCGEIISLQLPFKYEQAKEAIEEFQNNHQHN